MEKLIFDKALLLSTVRYVQKGEFERSGKCTFFEKTPILEHWGKLEQEHKVTLYPYISQKIQIVVGFSLNILH